MVLAPALGNYAAGERFWDREREVRDIAAYLLDGQSVLLTGPRRIGKTSVVHRVLDALDESARTLFIDVEQCATPTEMFAGLAAAASSSRGAWERIQGWFSKRLGDLGARLEGVEVGILKVELQALMAGSWRDDARAIVSALAEEVTVVAVDELPLLIDRVLKRDVAEAELLMSTLRAFTSDFPAVRWLFSGSIGLEPVLHRHGLSATINNLRSYPIDAWDRGTTIGAFAALAGGVGLVLDDEAADAAYDCLGLGVPYHVQLLVDELRRDGSRRGDQRVSAVDVERVYGGSFITSAVRTHLLHLESRLRVVLGEGDALRLAHDLLTQAAVAGVATEADAAALADDVVEVVDERAATLREVLEILEHDAYLHREAGGWSFRSRLVRDWWRRGNEFGFVLASERRPQR